LAGVKAAQFFLHMADGTRAELSCRCLVVAGCTGGGEVTLKLAPAALGLESGGDLSADAGQILIGRTQSPLQPLDLPGAWLLWGAGASKEVVEELLELVAVAPVAAAQDDSEAAQVWTQLLDDDVHRLVHFGGEQDGLAAGDGIQDELGDGEGFAGARRANDQREGAVRGLAQHAGLGGAEPGAGKDGARGVTHGGRVPAAGGGEGMGGRESTGGAVHRGFGSIAEDGGQWD